MPEQAVNQPFDEFFTCSICMGVVSTDMIECSQCNKLNCRACIEDWCKKQKNCPNCRADFTPQAKVNLYVVNLLKDFKFHCPKCNEVYKYTDHLKHWKSCPSTLYRCPVEKCEIKDLAKKELLTHLRDECNLITLTCSKCKLSLTRPETADHDCISSLLLMREKDQAEIKRLTERENDFMLNLMPKLLKEH